MGDKLHWVVRLNGRNRSVSFALLFPVLGTWLAENHAGPAQWTLLALQFLAYPQLAYWRARLSGDPLRAEMHNLLIDDALFGAWIAAWGFPLWIGFMLCICACLNLMIFEGVPGLWKAVAATCAGAAASAASFGLHFHPDTPLRTTLPCILVLSLYLLMFAHGGYMRGLALRDSRRQLSDKLEEVSALQAKLQEQVARDSLTGLYNRRHFDLAFARQLQACREGGEAMTLTMIDIDHFKRINDTYGHLAGDEMLKRLAELLAARTRGDGLACRYGGEEFLLALPGTAARAQALAEELRGEFEAARVEFDGYSMHTTLSFGIAAFPDDGGVPVDLLKAADVALYVAKLRGRNCVVLSAEAA